MRQLALSLVVLGSLPSIAAAQDTLREQVLTMGVSEEVVLIEYPSLSLGALATTAGAAVHVKVRSSDTFLSNGGRSIMTDYRASVVDVVKDSSARINVGDIITIRRVGGTTNIEGRPFFSNESGFPAFAKGGEYVLFLKTDAGQPYELVAGPRSAFQVHQGAVAPAADSSTGSTAVLLPLFLHDLREQLVVRTSQTR